MRSRPDLSDHSAHPAAPPKTPPTRHLLNLTLRGLPELNYFDSEEQRQRALQEIGTEAANMKSLGFWLAILALVVSTFAARFIAGWLLSYVQWHHEVEDLLRIAAMLGAAFLVLRRLHRWGAAADLRQKLTAAGIPVCLKCGYLLRGLPLEPGRCPECGAAFGDAVGIFWHERDRRCQPSHRRREISACAGDVGQRQRRIVPRLRRRARFLPPRKRTQ